MHRRLALALVPLALLAVAVPSCGSDDLATTDERGGSTSTSTSVSPGGGTDGDVDPGVEVSGEGYHGWILDPDADVETGWLVGDSVAAPVWASEAGVARAEEILAGQIPERRDAETNEYSKEKLVEVASRLDEYERQYIGARADGTDGDADLVYVNALCTTDFGGEPDAISTSVMVVMDGGACFWTAVVDLTSGEITRLSVNGDA